MLLYALDLGGTLVFALSGGFRAAKHELDLLGVLVLAVATGVGGGLIRDVLLGENPPAAFRDEWYLAVCIAGGIAVFFAAPRIAARWNWVMVADAIGLGLFAAMGAVKAQTYGLGPIGVVMMGGLTATGGGVIRDLLVRELPAVIHKGFYATAALAGGLSVVVLNALGVPESMQLLTAVSLTTGLRFYALDHNVNLPRATRLPGSPSDMTGKRG